MSHGPELIPAASPLPLPGPTWLFHLLLVATFFLHLLFVNLTLGGTLLATWGRLTGRGASHRILFANRLLSANVYGISFAITTGVAPLLFLQLLYGTTFYSAGILLGGAWLGFVVLMLLGYYAVYLDKHRAAGSDPPGAGWLVLASLCFLAIAMVHVAVHLVHVQPERWGAIADRPLAVLADSTYWPRLLHFLTASLGFSALFVACWRRPAGSEPAVEDKLRTEAWRWVAVTTALQILGGFWLLLSLPQNVVLGLMRGGATTLLPVGLSLAFGIALLSVSTRSNTHLLQRAVTRWTLGGMTAVIALMSVTRHQVRRLYLSPFVDGAPPSTVSQWGGIALFVLLLVAAVATIGAMVAAIRRERAWEPARRAAGGGG